MNRQLEVQQDVIGNQQGRDSMLAFDPRQVMRAKQIIPRENQGAEQYPRTLSLPSPLIQPDEIFNEMNEFQDIPEITCS